MTTNTTNTTNMLRSAKRLVLTNDPKYGLEAIPLKRTIDDVLHRIEVNSKISRSSVEDMTQSDPVLMKTPEKRNKRQKRRSEPQIRHSSPKVVSTQSWPQSSTHSWGQSSTQSRGESSTQSESQSDIRVFKVIYGTHKPYKKHKQFTSDGFLTIRTKDLFAKLYSLEGKGLQSSSKIFKRSSDISEGNRVVIGSNELEIDNEVSAKEFKSGKYFVKSDD